LEVLGTAAILTVCSSCSQPETLPEVYDAAPMRERLVLSADDTLSGPRDAEGSGIEPSAGPEVPVDLAGVWSRGTGLEASSLYLFPDKSFQYSEEADTVPETVYTRGTWRFLDGAVFLSPDGQLRCRYPGLLRNDVSLKLVYVADGVSEARLPSAALESFTRIERFTAGEPLELKRRLERVTCQP